jgi:uncharacterized protein
LEFLQGIAAASGCGILLDVNNLHISARNFGFDAHAALQSLDAASIKQYHISGFTRQGQLLHDTHDRAVADPVWRLLDDARQRFGPKPLILERDDGDVQLETMLEELASYE